MAATTGHIPTRPRRCKAGAFSIPCQAAPRGPAVPLEVRLEPALPGEEEKLARRARLDVIARLWEQITALRRRMEQAASQDGGELP